MALPQLLLTIMSPLQRGTLEAEMDDDTFRTHNAMLD